MADSRDVFIGTDSSGADYWLVPRKGPGGHRQVEIRKSRKQVPECLQGLWTDANAAIAVFQQYTAPKKKQPDKADAES